MVLCTFQENAISLLEIEGCWTVSWNERIFVSVVWRSCLFLHPVVGDVERKFHYRYFKTCACVYDVDSSGICIKNGVHCPYAHGAADLRAPVFDSRDLRHVNEEDPELASKTFSILVQETYFEDPAWEGISMTDLYCYLNCYKI